MSGVVNLPTTLGPAAEYVQERDAVTELGLSFGLGVSAARAHDYLLLLRGHGLVARHGEWYIWNSREFVVQGESQSSGAAAS